MRQSCADGWLPLPALLAPAKRTPLALWARRHLAGPLADLAALVTELRSRLAAEPPLPGADDAQESLNFDAFFLWNTACRCTACCLCSGLRQAPSHAQERASQAKKAARADAALEQGRTGRARLCGGRRRMRPVHTAMRPLRCKAASTPHRSASLRPCCCRPTAGERYSGAVIFGTKLELLCSSFFCSVRHGGPQRHGMVGSLLPFWTFDDYIQLKEHEITKRTTVSGTPRSKPAREVSLSGGGYYLAEVAAALGCTPGEVACS